jgi:hypothetical protein
LVSSISVTNVRPNKIKVLVLRQRRPLKILADGTFLLPYRKKHLREVLDMDLFTKLR